MESRPTVQLVAMLHNKSACHEFLGDSSSALQARCLRLLRLPPFFWPPLACCQGIASDPHHPHPSSTTFAAQATEKGLTVAGKLRLPSDDELVLRLTQSKKKLVKNLTDPKAKASSRPKEEVAPRLSPPHPPSFPSPPPPQGHPGRPRTHFGHP